jgi:hypothetical protein
MAELELRGITRWELDSEPKIQSVLNDLNFRKPTE